MSECAGKGCTHPECVSRRESLYATRERAAPAVKHETMNRAARRAETKRIRRARKH